MLRIVVVLMVGLIALGVRIYFADRHNVGDDEPTYLSNALDYANLIRTGQYPLVAWYQENYQHPVLSKILYGVVLLTQPPLPNMHKKYLSTGMPIQSAEGRPWVMAARYTSVILGTLTSIVIALVDPLAGLFFATQSLIAIFTSLAGLEALPLLTSFLSAIFYLRWAKQYAGAEDPPAGSSVWLALSAIALGITAAAKYTYCIVGVAIFLHYILTCARKPKLLKLLPKIVVWVTLSLLVFLIFDPYLWPDPIERLRNSLFFHVSYSESTNVSGAGYPWWQPLIWLSSPYYRLFPVYRNQIPFGPDRLISVLALIGLPGLWKKESDSGASQARSSEVQKPAKGKARSGLSSFFRHYPGRPEGSSLYLIWLAAGLVMVLVWPTKWAQYVLIMMVPMCLSASLGARMLYNWLKERTFLIFHYKPGLGQRT